MKSVSARFFVVFLGAPRLQVQTQTQEKEPQEDTSSAHGRDGRCGRGTGRLPSGLWWCPLQPTGWSHLPDDGGSIRSIQSVRSHGRVSRLFIRFSFLIKKDLT